MTVGSRLDTLEMYGPCICMNIHRGTCDTRTQNESIRALANRPESGLDGGVVLCLRLYTLRGMRGTTWRSAPSNYICMWILCAARAYVRAGIS
jgi:hypothetical protein